MLYNIYGNVDDANAETAISPKYGHYWGTLYYNRVTLFEDFRYEILRE